MANRDVISAVKKSLKAFLQSEIAGLTVNEDFPNPSENLKYPCCTILSGNPTFESTDPYVLDIGVVSDLDPSPSVENRKAPVVYCLGQMQFDLQLDLWESYRPKRDELFNKVFFAINKEISRIGLSLQLTDYFDQYAHFFIKDFRPIDDEASRQRKEYRYMINLSCSVNVVNEKLEHIIEQVENNSSVTDDTIP